MIYYTFGNKLDCFFDRNIQITYFLGRQCGNKGSYAVT